MSVVSKQKYPIIEFDKNKEAIIKPKYLIEDINFPEYAVACFFPEVIKKIKTRADTVLLTKQKSEMGWHPIYQVELSEKKVAVFHPGVGAPLVAAMLEEVIALGSKHIIACGGCGVLYPKLELGTIIVPTSAVRDEGTSYHYLPPSREVKPSRKAVFAIKKTLENFGFDYVTGKTWTTDAVYRETAGKVNLRKSEKCITVEMEASAMYALGKFRGVDIGQVMYGGDYVSDKKWDHRGWNSVYSIREQLFNIACHACCNF